MDENLLSLRSEKLVQKKEIFLYWKSMLSGQMFVPEGHSEVQICQRSVEMPDNEVLV